MNSSVIRQLNISRGIKTLKIPSFIGTENLLNDAVTYAEKEGFVSKGDRIVCLMGQKEETPDQVNIIKVTCI
jgi:pyruvate kinase